MGRPGVKDQLVDRALGVLLERGFDGTSVNDLVAAAGIPKGSFYNYFSSKEDFAVEQVTRYVQSLGLDELLIPASSNLTLVHQHFERQVTTRRAAKMKTGCLLSVFSISVSDAHPDLRGAVRDGFRQWIAALTAALARARDAAEMNSAADPADIASALVDSFQGALIRSRAIGRRTPLNQFLDNTFNTLTRPSLT
ncbi:TetR/AcrR family transcriptional regulator [Mycolicibacterium sp. 018/SC-01/001]|uniref:TetR/AcrR family transcriptional regulator n=1 Tax=Mycolicibacterium sp. 018/SC-01/001 TaxID=2592069 RepID=UPI001180D69C|nr:TetR/AcrR family transcriptional regulator [Mycolicibacterium sp. 018/SC-01/001]TRW89167.1 TetR/AcrR family transcriptional regulator [Mycolicibacterium sp. 018/SC-01/001]